MVVAENWRTETLPPGGLSVDHVASALPIDTKKEIQGVGCRNGI